MKNATPLTCACGRVRLLAEGKPIISAQCLCADCQEAGAFLQSLANARSVLDENGATRFELYRKDRVACEGGGQHLREHRLSAGSKTRRVIATCCNTPMFLEFADGHWLSLYGGLWPQQSLPPLEIRTMTRDRRAGIELPDDVPNPRAHTLRFYAKLLQAWVAMRFRVPKVDYVHGVLDGQ